jgi:hypothetical protein
MASDSASHEPAASPLRLYGSPSDRHPLDWSWVENQLADAGTYWVVAHSSGHPHPRPVWGVWLHRQLHLSIGSPAVRAALRTDPVVTVHLDSGTDVVIVEGRIATPTTAAGQVIDAYNRKYEWEYRVEDYGELTVIHPLTVLAWRTAGLHGRGSFQETGRWSFGPTPS